MNILINKKAFEKIMELVNNGFIFKRNFLYPKLSKFLLSCGVIEEINSRPTRYSLINEKTLYTALKQAGYNIYSINDLKKLIEAPLNGISKDEVFTYVNDSKKIKSYTFKGLMISVLKPLKVTLKEKNKIIVPPIEGSATFIHYIQDLKLLDETIVVGIENPQVLWYINKYEYLFDSRKDYIFVSLLEYKSSYQYEWISSIKNEYIHFGDFDLAGISIYLNNIVPKLKNCKRHSFFIPSNIEKIIIITFTYRNCL